MPSLKKTVHSIKTFEQLYEALKDPNTPESFWSGSSGSNVFWRASKSGPKLNMYIRRGRIVGIRDVYDFCISSVDASKPGKGLLTAFLNKYEPDNTIMFENVLNPALLEHLVTVRGYHRIPSADIELPCLLKQKSN